MGFEWSYRQGSPAWDIGRAQPAVVSLAEAGAFTRSVVDLGCGTGENAIYLASLGLPVTGVDAAPTAIARAAAKARQRGLPATFRVADALELPRLGATFDAALDCGLFHVFSDEERVPTSGACAPSSASAAAASSSASATASPGPWDHDG